MSETTVELTNERQPGVAGDAALEVGIALGELAAGIRLAKAEIRRMRASAAGWAARGAWGSTHPSVHPQRPQDPGPCPSRRTPA